MEKRIGTISKLEILRALRGRYSTAEKKAKTKILDEFTAVSGYHRKHAIRLLVRQSQKSEDSPHHVRSARIYSEAVREALIFIWEAADRICGKRLKAIMPEFVESLTRYGHLQLDPEVRRLLMKVSASTIDRQLSPVRKHSKQKQKRKQVRKISKQIPVRTSSDWNGPLPGYLEIDFVVHGGTSMAGSFINSLVVTDVCSGWVEAVPLLAREQSFVVEGLEKIRQLLPFSILGIDSDNEGAFINDTLFDYCKRNNFEFTRSRPYHKNDQAYIEQKNGSVIRRFTGYNRYSGIVAAKVFTQLYSAVRLYVNHFQPSFKLKSKERSGSHITKRYHKPATPYNRLLAHEAVAPQTKEMLQSIQLHLDPIELLHSIRETQQLMADLCSPKSENAPKCGSLDEFLVKLPEQWRSGEVRPTHRKIESKRYWRTRRDPFEQDWSAILRSLNAAPDTTAKLLLEELMAKNPGKYSFDQLRTLQRRVKEWRAIMAQDLVFADLAYTMAAGVEDEL